MQADVILIEVLNDLIEINNDRIKCYAKASDETKEVDSDLKAIFAILSKKSMRYVCELTQQVVKVGGESATAATNRGKIYREWMEAKKAIATNDRLAILQACEIAEDAAQTAYEDTLATDADINVEIRKLIVGQKLTLRGDYRLIKKYVEAHNVISI